MRNDVNLTEEIIASLAPDAASVKAAKQLVQRGAFSQARRSPDGRWLLARARGSMAQPYLTKAELAGGEARFSCECGSMKYPCKHALGLLYLAMQRPDAFTETSAVASNNPISAVTMPLAVPASGPTEPPKDEGEALWQAIFAEPEEPAHRLVYADWLDERGDSALAQFIRVQCEIERGAEGKRLEALRKQEKQLLAKNRTKWMADVPKHLRSKVGMRGGFVGHLELPAKALRKYGAELFDRYPIYSVQLSDPYPKQETSQLAVEPFWGRVRWLVLRMAPATVLETLLSGYFLHSLRAFDLTGNDVGIRGCSALANWAGLKGLAVLRLPNAAITDGAVAALCAGGPAALGELDLANNGISSAGAETLAGCAALAGLRALSLRNNKVGPKGAQALATSPRLASLRDLNLSGNPITDQGAKALAESPHLGGLALLHLHNVELSDGAVAALRERFGDRVRFT
jgi:uncharacterized protein (TIGR02996 family)